MTEEEVKREIKTPAVLEAFERAKLLSLPEAVKESYQEEDVIYGNLSTYIEGERAKGKAEGIARGKEIGQKQSLIDLAQKMLKEGFEIEVISKITGLSQTDIQS